ncbi:YheT family hydrolase [Thiomonas bhubaneswarensis]|uniref:Predicted hydrolase of the alpha/beta-hydrolase fold n=1 Tax=Thiomonas bhubaneswarensis TaxID=339866 RepID=A0A0K6HW78_9BURK|nr:alpha/beta fold hydrolase [Thiomonas bhubaneswarensis]CUA95135.1 Predicted hydrolase of the alpha/beta-hydrolase fold [Thiomonas bhubaneswarensis]
MPTATPYVAPAWLPGGQLQTVLPALISRPPGDRPALRRERWATPDGDFIDVDWLASPASPSAPLLVLFHGLEGSSQSHYAQAVLAACARAGWRCAVPHFRGCSGEDNRAPRAYHSGDFAEIDWILARFSQNHPTTPLYAAGVSLGGNALLRWAQEQEDAAALRVRAIAAVSAPLDLAAGGRAIASGLSYQIYTRMFLRTLKPKALRMIARHPGLTDAERVRRARDLGAFDDAFTAPIHGFRDAADYWARASSKPHLHRLRLPTLILNARNDPFQPASVLPDASAASSWVRLEQPQQGGHVGFAQGHLPGRLDWLPMRLLHFFEHGN